MYCSQYVFLFEVPAEHSCLLLNRLFSFSIDKARSFWLLNKKVITFPRHAALLCIWASDECSPEKTSCELCQRNKKSKHSPFIGGSSSRLCECSFPADSSFDVSYCGRAIIISARRSCFRARGTQNTIWKLCSDLQCEVMITAWSLWPFITHRHK